MVNVALICEFREFLEQSCFVREDFVFLSRILLEIIVELVGVGQVLHRQWTLIEFLVVHLVKTESRDRCVRVLLLLRKEGNEVGDEFLKLCQVQCHIILIKDEIVIVHHFGGNRKFEIRLVELLDHLPAGFLNSDHLVLDVGNGRIRILVRLLVVGNFLFHGARVLLLGGIGHSLKHFVLVDLQLNLFVLLFD